jgi:hypothetical protein
MGMFDSILVKRDLPVPTEVAHLNIDWKTCEFQTKDLENVMASYIINEQGRLVEHIIERDYIPWSEEERKKEKYKPWDLWKEVKILGERWEDQNYHGSILFYAYESFSDTEDFSVDFKAYFTYGNLDKIELLEFKRFKSTKLHNEEIGKLRAQEQKRFWPRFKHYASYLGWSWCWKKIAHALYRVGNSVQNLQYFIWRNML